MIMKSPTTNFDQLTGTVLIAEDDAGQRELYRLILKAENKEITFVTVENGLEAFEKVNSINPDAVIADIQMPGLSGINLCRQIKANPETRDISVLLISALCDAERENVCIQAGADGLFSKPLNAAQMSYHLRSAIHVRRLLARCRSNSTGYPQKLDREITNRTAARIKISSEMLMWAVGSRLSDKEKIILSQINKDSANILNILNRSSR